MPKSFFSPELLREWDDRLDSMELLFSSGVMLDEPYEEAVEAVQKLRRLIREILPFENVPIVVSSDEER
jgi:hypothetical protein